MEDKIEIELSKRKIVLLLIGALIFVVFGVLFIINPEQFAVGIFRNSQVIRIVGVLAVGFFGFCLVLFIKKLFDNKLGLIIDKNGITDNTNANSIGLIEWADITGIETIKIASTKILILLTDKPDKYIDRAKNRLIKRTLKTNYKMYGSPLSITSNSLKLKYNDLEKLLLDEFEKRKQHSS